MKNRDASGRIVSNTICGRRNCSVCKRWRHQSDYGVRSWRDEEKTIPKYLHSECKNCRNELTRERYNNMTLVEKKRRVQSSRAWYRRKRRQEGKKEIGARVLTRPNKGSVRREPFAQWLQEKLDSGLTTEELALRTGLSSRQIRTYLSGYQVTGKRAKTGKSKLYPVDWVSFSLVDRTFFEYGDYDAVNRFYPLSEDEVQDDDTDRV